MAGFCRIWILGLELMATPLYEATKGPDTKSLLWNREQEKVLNDIKQALPHQSPYSGWVPLV